MVGGTGRKKIEIRKIEDVMRRRVTFSKRKKGLFRKVEELGILTGCKVAAIVFSDFERRAYTAGDLSVLNLYDNNETSNTSCFSTKYDHAGGEDNYLSASTSLGLPELEDCGLCLDDLEWMDDVKDNGDGVPSAENKDDYFWEALELPQFAETMGSSEEIKDPNRGVSYNYLSASTSLGLPEPEDCGLCLDDLEWMDDVKDNGDGAPSAENKDDYFWEALELPQFAETMGSSEETKDLSASTSLGLPEPEDCGLCLDDLEWMDDVKDNGDGAPSAENKDDYFWEALGLPQFAETMGSSEEIKDPNRGVSYNYVNTCLGLPEVTEGLRLEELLDMKKKLEELKFKILQQQLMTGDGNGNGDFIFTDFNRTDL